MTFEDFKVQVATKYKLGKTLVTGHRAQYFEEAAQLYAEFKAKEAITNYEFKNSTKDIIK